MRQPTYLINEHTIYIHPITMYPYNKQNPTSHRPQLTQHDVTTHTDTQSAHSSYNQYVSRDDFNNLCKSVENLAKEVNKIKEIVTGSRTSSLVADHRRYSAYSLSPSPIDRQLATYPSHSRASVESFRDDYYDYATTSQVYRPDVIVSSHHDFKQPKSHIIKQNAIEDKIPDLSFAGAVRTPSYHSMSPEGAKTSIASPVFRDNSSKPSSVKSSSQEYHMMINNLFFMSKRFSSTEIIMLWDRGLDNIPPILSWPYDLKFRYQNHLRDWFKVYHLFRTTCQGDIGRFVSRFTNEDGDLMSVIQIVSYCPDIGDIYNSFIRENYDTSAATYETFTQKKVEIEKSYTLPRKINGRKVSAKDVIQLWEYGIGDIPPIRTWTKAQKFKQQSKISRWKKIVDIFKYQCNNDMAKFESIYTDSHGCLLPVAAITSRFETVYGDEFNITSKLMTVSTDGNAAAGQERSLKRSVDSVFTDDDERSSEKYRKTVTYSEDEESDTNPSEINLNKSITWPTEKYRHEIIEKFKNGEKENAVESSDSYLQNNCVLNYSNNSSPSCSDENSEVATKYDFSYLPSRPSLEECILLWENGIPDVLPPLYMWDYKSKENEVVQKIEKIYYIYELIFEKNKESFISACNNENLKALNEIIQRFSEQLRQLESKRLIDERLTGKTSSMTFDFSHHRTISECPDVLYLLPRKINGRKVNARDVLQLWYYGLNKIPPVKEWGPQHKAVQQSKISRWKKIVDIFEQEYDSDWENFEKTFSNKLGHLLPITAIIAKHEGSYKSIENTMANIFDNK